MLNKKQIIWIFLIIILIIAFIKISSAGIPERLLGEQERPINQLFWIAGFSFIAMLIVADFTGRSAEKVGSHLGAAVGIILIAVSSSLPELVVSILSALEGHANIAVANVIGSNMANIALILGVVAIIRPVKIKKGFAKSSLFFILIIAAVGAMFYKATIFPGELTYSPIIGRALMPQEGLILIVLFAVYCLFMKIIGMGEAPEKKGKLTTAIILTIIGGLGIWFCAEFAIDAIIKIAVHYKLSETIIAATLIAVGTSLPEFAISIIATLKGKQEQLFGNLISSNAFNSTICLGIAAVIGAFLISSSIIAFHLPFMILTSLVILFMSFKNEIKRTDGIILVVIYAIYVILMISGEPALFLY